MPNASAPVWAHAAVAPDRIALRGSTVATWTYGQLRERASAVRELLDAHHVGPGDRVLLVAPSVPEFAMAYYGILGAGAIAVTANTMATERELTYMARDADVRLVLAWTALAPAARRTADELGVPFREMREGLAGIAHASATPEPHPVDADDTAAILYTSGTTGKPKGAQLTHGNLASCAAIFCDIHAIGADDRAVTGLPLFHVFGQACVMGTTMRAGGSLTLLERFDAGSMMALIRRDRPTFIAGVPTMWNALLRATDEAGADFAGLRLASSGGASLPVEVMRAFEKRFGCTIVEGYGLTETTGAATCHLAGEPARPGTVGRALPGCAVAVRDDEGAELPQGEVGEVHIKGPVVMKGYWNRPDATGEALDADGWLRTGDLGSLDAEGDLRIVDRKKDLVIRGGYNVYPREVEEVLYEHPDIVEAAVIGVPDPHYGEEVAAVVALRPGAALDIQALRAWAKERLSAYKVPHLLAVVDELPKGATGKILKRAIDPAVVTGGRV
ncbi:long-chain fatty acid--CoA ligase [Streptomyces sp. NBC_01016]|uniref:long-chain-fatty-acid--CoA ligase n=1 Tax=Streptomyces sp. NBC_01016 TaxID=2903720 RepID=UPI002257AAFD|nr:long-chain fatty acid--CoA ligase [Streptomyces sp. NBC_01016]MCX4835613.1 long-chain fatty acid--CoA ligase [Streptomyces sp. NBC_01016]